MVALTRGFMYAGAARVIASLWKVEEDATVDLMKDFYQNLLHDKKTVAASLQQAQIAAWRKHPVYANCTVADPTNRNHCRGGSNP